MSDDERLDYEDDFAAEDEFDGGYDGVADNDDAYVSDDEAADEDVVESDTESVATDAADVADADDFSIENVEPAVEDTNIVRADLIEEVESIPPTMRHVKRIVVVSTETWMTSDMMTKYEFARLTSIRAKQIAKYNNPFIDITGMTDPIEMAHRELKAGMCPLILRRPLGRRIINGEVVEFVEDRCPNDLDFPDVVNI